MATKKDTLTIIVHPDLIAAKEIFALTAAGHDVKLYSEVGGFLLESADLILGPNCWRVTPDLTKFIKSAVTAAKATKKRRAKKSG
jgi:hypothetical protein